MSGVIVEVDAKTGRSEERLEAINRSLRNIESSSRDTSVALGSMVKTLMTAATTAISAVSLQKISDEFTNMSNQIAMVTGRTRELTVVQGKLSAVARETFSSVSSTSEVFSSLGRSMKQAGVGTSQIVKATASVQRAIALSGANAQTSAGALLQLSQGLSSGTLRGEELNSVLEGTPRLAQAIADSMGVTTGKLRLIAAEGQLTSDKVFSALLSQSKELEKEFSAFKPTLSQAGAQFSDSFKKAVNEFDKGLGISNAIAASLAHNGAAMTKLADGAYEFGNNLRVGIQKSVGNAKLLFGPMWGALSELGKQFREIFSDRFFGRTLRGDLNGIIATFDTFTGGLLTSLKNFSFASFFDLRTPVENAIRQLKGLNPANWAGFGLNKETFARIFNLEYLHKVGAGFVNLRDAIKDSSDSIFIDLEKFGNEVAFFSKKIIKYFDLTRNAFFLLKPGNSEAFFTSMEGIVRGLSGVSIKIWDTMSYLKRLMAPAFDTFIMAMEDSAGAFAKGIAAGMFAVGKAIFELIEDIVLAFADMQSGFSIRHVFGNVLDSFDRLSEAFSNVSTFDKVKEYFKQATESIGDYFRNLDLSVFHGIWKSAVNYVADTASELADGVAKQFDKMVKFIIKLIKAVGSSIKNGFSKIVPDDLFGGNSLKSQVDKFKDLLSSVGSSSFSLTSFSGISETFSSVLDSIKTKVKSFIEVVQELLSGLGDNVLGNKLSAIGKSIGSSFEDVFKSFYRVVSTLSQKMFKVIASVADELTGLAAKAVDATLHLGNDTGAQFLVKSIRNSMLASFYDLFNLSGKATQLFAQTFNAVVSLAVSGLYMAFDAVKKFADKVIYEFFRIYDEVIGHSWWTDTVETVVDTSNTLWDRASGGLQKFRSKVSDLFESVFKQKKSFDLGNITANFESTKFKLPEIDTSDVFTKIEMLGKKITDTFKTVFEKFPDMARLAMTAAAAVLVTLLFPAGKLKTIIASTLVSSVLSQSTLLGEAFGKSLTGHSFISAAASAAGSLAGFILSSVVKEIPQIVDVMLTVVSSFTKAFSEQLPIIGGMISSLFGGLSAAGLGSGPLGIVGLWLFGKGATGIMREFNIGTGLLNAFDKNLRQATRYISGNGDGFISKYLFGIPGPQRVIASAMLVLDAMGTFDSFFAGSELLHIAGKAGLFYTMLYGKDGYDKVVDTIGDALHYVTDILKKGIKQITAGTHIGDLIFSNAKGDAKVEGIDSFLKDAFATINKKIIDAATPYFDKGMDIVKKILFGKNPELTKAGIVAYLYDVRDSMLKALNKVREPLARAYDKISEQLAGFQNQRKKRQAAKAKDGINAKDFIGDIPDAIDRLRRRFSDNKRKPEDVGSAFDFSGLKEKIADIAGRFGFKPKVDTAKFGEDVKTMKSSVTSSVSENGLLGMLFFGKYAKFAWVAILATVISTAASAATTQLGKSTTPFEDLVNNWNEFKLDNPFEAVVLQVIGVTLPTLMIALIAFRQQVGAVIGNFISAQGMTSVATGMTRLATTIRKHIPAIKAGLAGGVGAALGYVIGDWAGGPEMAQIGILMGATMLAGFGSFILSSIGSVLGAIGGAIIGAVGWVGVAVGAMVVAGLGALYVMFFGEKGKFMEDLAEAKDRILELLHLRSKKDATLGLSEDDSSFLRKVPGVKVDYNLESINTNNIKSADKDNLQKSIDELSKHIGALRDEERRYGKVSGGSVETTNSMLEGLKVYVDKLSAKSEFDPDKFAETIKDLNQGNPRNLMQRLVLSTQQADKDFLYGINKRFLEIFRDFAGEGKKAKWTDKLDALKAERDTKYNARYRPTGVLEEVLSNFENGTKNFQDSSPAQVALSKLIEKQKDQYQRTLQEIRKKEGGSLFDPVGDPNYKLDVNNPLNMKLQKIGGELLANYFQKLHFEKHAGDIRMFNSELDGMVANFKEAGISFDSSALFAKDNAAFDYITSLSKEAKQLADQLKQTRDVAERNKIIIRIEEVRTKIEKQKNEAELADTGAQRQYKLKDKLGQIGINSFSDDIYKFIDDKLADNVFERAGNLKSRSIDTERKSQEAMKAAGVGNVNMLPANIKAPFLQQMESIRKDTMDLQTFIENSVQESMSAGNAFSEIAKGVGGDFNTMVRSVGVEKAIIGLNKLNDLSKDAKISLDHNDIDAWHNLNIEMETLRDRLQTIPMNFSDLTSQLSNLGTSFTLDDTLTLSPGTLHALEAAAKGMREIDFAIQHDRGDLSPARLKAFADQKLKLISIAKEAAIQISYSTGDKISQMLGNSGFNDPFEQSSLSSMMLKDFKLINTEIQRIKDALADPRNVKQFTTLQQNLYAAQQFMKKMKDDVKGFEGRLDTTNSTFNTNLSKQEFANLKPQTAFDMSTSAQVFADKLAEAGKKFIKEGSLEAFTEYGKLLAKQRKESFDTAVDAQKDGAKYRSDVSNISSTTTSELIDGIVGVVPALGDMKTNLEAISRIDLEDLFRKSLEFSDRKRNIDLNIGGETIDALNRDKERFTDSTAMQLRQGGSLRGRVSRAGGNLDDDAFGRISRQSSIAIDKLASDINAAKKLLASPSLSIESRNRLQDRVDSMFVQMEDAIKAASVNRHRVAYEAGQSFANSIVDGFNNAFTGLIQRKAEEGKTTWTTFRDAIFTMISENVIKTFVDGLSNAVMGEGSPIRNALANIGSNIFSQFKGVGSSDGTGATDTSTSSDGGILDSISSFMAPVVGGLSAIFGATSSGATATTTAIEGAAMSIVAAVNSGTFSIVSALTAGTAPNSIGTGLKFLQLTSSIASGTPTGVVSAADQSQMILDLDAFATGGMIRGPGTGTSDSIPAMLSNGEFVINAAQTAKFKPLLEAINNGNMSFAAGGLVTPSPYVTPTSSNTVTNSSSQQININITGDISRQTKAEIHRLIPVIATGVNAHNREVLMS